MDYRSFYRQLFAPLEALFGPIDRETLVAIVGFDMGGPLNFCTIGRGGGGRCVTYVSCELSVRKEQKPSEFGRYELLVSCDDEQWVRSIVSAVGRLTLEERFGHGHTLDIGPWVDPTAVLQGVVFEGASTSRIGPQSYGVLRVIGVTRPEMELAQDHGLPALIKRLKAAGIYPETRVQRKSVM